MKYRHGDISFHAISRVPVACKQQYALAYVAAYGEATGHHHEIHFRPEVGIVGDLPADSDTMLPKITIHTSDDGRRFVEFDSTANLDHPEHGRLCLVPGIYEIREERTFDYFENSIKKVID